MNMQAHQAHDIQVLNLSGRFDAHGVPSVVQWLEKATSTNPRVVVNLNGVNFIDSSALAALVQGMKRCRQHEGDLRLCNMQQPVRIIFELTRLNKAFMLYEQESEALQSFAS